MNLFGFKNPFYDFLLEKSSINKISFVPENLWTGDLENGRKIINGFLSFDNESIVFDLETWKKNKASKGWNEKLHSFEWVDDIKALRTNKARIFLRNNLKQWLLFHSNWDPSKWKINILSKRICNLLSNASFFYETADDEFQKRFSKTLSKQSIHLLKNYKIKLSGSEKIFIPKAIIISSTCFRNLENKLELGMKLLHDIIQTDISDDGMHYLRSPSNHFFFLKSLIDIKNFLSLSNYKIPRFLNDVISKMGAVLKFFKINSNELAIFNDYNFVEHSKLNEVIKRSNTKIRTPDNINNSGFQRISENRLTLIMDCGSPNNEKTYAGSLSFEFSHIGEKIVVNSGSPFVNDKKWHEAMRSTAAHSTMTIDDYNSSDIFFEKNTDTRIANVWSEKLQDKGSFWINSAHSGYNSLFGLIHNRKIHVDSKNLIIRGQDYFSKSTKFPDKIPRKLFLRFHIHPDIKSNVTVSKKKVLLKLKNNIAWEFICSEAKIELRDGIYLGTKKKIDNNYIEICEKLLPEKKIKWAFRLIR